MPGRHVRSTRPREHVHPLIVLVAFGMAAVVTYVTVLLALHVASSVSSRDGRQHDREGSVPRSVPLPPWAASSDRVHPLPGSPDERIRERTHDTH